MGTVEVQESNPSAANCELSGDGYRNTLSTPARLALPKAAAPITMSCGAPGYRTFVTTLTPRFNPRILGNLLIGSSLGLVVDIVADRDTVYPERVFVFMEPAAFRTARSRDRWYRLYRDHVERKWHRVVSDIQAICAEDVGEETVCMDGVATAQGQRDRELTLLEIRRRHARVETSAARRLDDTD